MIGENRQPMLLLQQCMAFRVGMGRWKRVRDARLHELQ